MAGVNGGAVPRSPASYVPRVTARAARRDVMCRAGGDPLQVVLCSRQRGQVAWPCGARVLVARRGGRRAGAVAWRGACARSRARVRGQAERARTQCRPSGARAQGRPGWGVRTGRGAGACGCARARQCSRSGVLGGVATGGAPSARARMRAEGSSERRSASCSAWARGRVEMAAERGRGVARGASDEPSASGEGGGRPGALGAWAAREARHVRAHGPGGAWRGGTRGSEGRAWRRAR